MEISFSPLPAMKMLMNAVFKSIIENRNKEKIEKRRGPTSFADYYSCRAPVYIRGPPC